MIFIKQPPYEINSTILNLVTKIIEKLTQLELNFNEKKDLHLRKISKIKSVNSSCAIEANTLSEEEVTTIINGKMIMASQNEILEVKNAYNVYVNIDKFNPYNINSFLDAHKLLTTDLIQESGKFRTGDVGVFDGNRVIHMGARPSFVPRLVEELFNWGSKSDLNPLIKSSIIHFEIEVIHPFNDGNGRIGRFWQSLILYRYNKIFEYLPIETLVYENQQKYYDALKKSEKEGNSTKFIEFMLKMILGTIENFVKGTSFNKIQDKYVDGLSRKEKEILMGLIVYFDKKELIDSESACGILNMTSVNIRKYFKKFTNLNILIPIGETKGRKYKINENIYK